MKSCTIRPGSIKQEREWGHARHADAVTVTDIIKDERVAHVRELKAEVARLKAERDEARAALASLESHFALALAAARDADRLPPGGTILMLDGWNIVFNSKFREDDAHAAKQHFIEAVRSYALAHPDDFTWLIFDGPEENSSAEGGFRLSYTGGDGEQRADRLIIDYLHQLRILGSKIAATIVTNDKALAKKAAAYGAAVRAVKEFADGL
ncbi:MAG: NYN domain-containing protein [Kiritimatiellae bacterium]|nr:NYN domain-containing protein [Kiritimatiellia bacterium]